MLSTPLICCSTGVATDCSTVSASAPIYVASSWISGGARLGNCAIGSCTMATMPMITIMIEMTMATIGWLMKNLDMAIYLGSDFAVGAGLASGIALRGLGLTVMPARTLWIPSATTLSPGFNPS